MILVSDLQILRNFNDFMNLNNIIFGEIKKNLSATTPIVETDEEFGILSVVVCLSCALRKTHVSTSSGELQTYQATYPFLILHIDLIGPFNVTSRGNKYVLIAIDRFTHWAELVPLPTATAETWADALVDWVISRHACPDKIIQFISKLFRRLSRRLGVKNLYTTASHPQSNARCERTNSWVERCIAIFSRET
jgi:hypothetical protein